MWTHIFEIVNKICAWMVTIARLCIVTYHTDEIPEAMPAYLHLICLYKGKRYRCRNKRSVQVQSEKSRGVTKRNMRNIVCYAYTYYIWIKWYTVLFRSQSAQFLQICVKRLTQFKQIYSSLHVYSCINIHTWWYDIIWYSYYIW